MTHSYSHVDGTTCLDFINGDAVRQRSEHRRLTEHPGSQTFGAFRAAISRILVAEASGIGASDGDLIILNRIAHPVVVRFAALCRR